MTVASSHAKRSGHRRADLASEERGQRMPARSFPLDPAPVRVPEEVLDDLRRRLAATRWPLDAANDDGYYGVRRPYLQELVAYWADGYDWRAAERAINTYEHYRADVGGVPVHFMRKPGTGPDPVPLILSHGWPWTFWHWSRSSTRLLTRPPRGATRRTRST
jgi:microsomal epoxide hydrolase